MVANGQVTDQMSPADAVRDRLDDPRVAAALNDLLDHADLLAILVGGLDSLVRRGDDITANVTSAIGELSGTTAQVPGLAEFKDSDLGELLTSLATLTGGLVKATPALSVVLNSPLTDRRSAEVLAALGEAVATAGEGTGQAPRGLRGLWKTMRTAAKDPDVTRGLVYLIEVARLFGRKV